MYHLHQSALVCLIPARPFAPPPIIFRPLECSPHQTARPVLPRDTAWSCTYYASSATCWAYPCLIPGKHTFEHGRHDLCEARSHARRVTSAKLQCIPFLHCIARCSLCPSSSSFTKIPSICLKQQITPCVFQSIKWLFVGAAAIQSGLTVSALIRKRATAP
jgi:hypothetical protein